MLKNKRISDGQNPKNILVLLFSLMAVLPCFADILPLKDGSSILDIFWLAKDVSSCGIVLLAAYLVPYERIEAKALLSVLALWRVFVMNLNIFNGDPIYSPVMLGACLIFLALFFVRCSRFKTVLSRLPADGEAAYALGPVSTAYGLIQAIFLIWHMGRYESRVVFDNGSCWMVRKGLFYRHHMLPDVAEKQGWVVVPIGRHLTYREKKTLDSLVGKKAITGIRDCRLLTVAGNPNEFIK